MNGSCSCIGPVIKTVASSLLSVIAAFSLCPFSLSDIIIRTDYGVDLLAGARSSIMICRNEWMFERIFDGIVGSSSRSLYLLYTSFTCSLALSLIIAFAPF